MSAHPYNPGVAGNNPDYYDESSSSNTHNNNTQAGLPTDMPVELAGDEPSATHLQPHSGIVSPLGAAAGGNGHQHQQNFAPSPLSGGGVHQGEKQQVPDYFPPPPPGPPPSGQQQQYYPPPPPGPPPGNTQQQQQQPYFAPPPAGAYGDGQGHDEQLPSYSDEFGHGSEFPADQKPPGLPPRPVSSSGQPPQFAPPHSAAYQQQFQPPPTHPSSSSHAAAAAAGVAAESSHKSKGGFTQKLYELSLKASGPINRITNKLGSEAFWPTSLDKECDKAARILKSFCKDGFYTTPQQTSQRPPSPGNRQSPGPKGKAKVLVKIPTSAIANAKGLAIFTTFRTGLHISGAGGSGVVVARMPDGSWSPPAGFLVHTLGAGLIIGLDIYDCVCVLNTQAAVDAFAKRARVSLGGELAVVAGPVGAGGTLEAASGIGSSSSQGQGQGQQQQQQGQQGTGSGHSRNNSSSGSKPVWSYMKSRGFYAGVQADGTIIIPRPDANAAFYGERGISVEKILKGEVQSHPPPSNYQTTSTSGADDKKKKKDEDVIVMWPEGGRQLMEVLKAAEGKRADPNVMHNLGNKPTPGDLAAAPGDEKSGHHQGDGLAY